MAHSNRTEGMEEADEDFHNVVMSITQLEGNKPEDSITASLLQTTLQTTIQLMNKTLADKLSAYLKPLADQSEEIKITVMQVSQKVEAAFELDIPLQEENWRAQTDIHLLRKKVIRLESSARKD
ncbi:UNVERIFIED_CONTAM: hypothetical protein K2H54_011497 [Gekko kuhli]